MTWIQSLLSDLDWPEAQYVLRIVVTIGLGAAIGLEREWRDKPAGLRTIILICLGACIFTILSQVVGGPDWNSTRIAAQVVTGIGFLGAGAIIQHQHSIVGLTTAATIWAVAAIGMAVGFGRIGLAISGTVAILIALAGFDLAEEWIGQRRDVQDYRIATANVEGAFERTLELFAKQGLRVRKRSCYEEGEHLVIQIVAMGAKPAHEQLRLTFARAEEYTLRRS